MGDWTIRNAASGNPCLCNSRPTPTAEGFIAGLGCDQHRACASHCDCEIEAIPMQEGFFFHKMRCVSGEPELIPWYLGDGDIDISNAIAAYQAKGAASYDASKTNLAHPGIFTLSTDLYDYDPAPLDGTPDWNAVDGWIFDPGDGYYGFDGFDTGMTIDDIGVTGSVIVFFDGTTLPVDGRWNYLFGTWMRNDIEDCPDPDSLSTYYNNGLYIGHYGMSDPDALRIINGDYDMESIPSNAWSSPLGVAGRGRYVNGVLLPPVVGGWEAEVLRVTDKPPIMIGACSEQNYNCDVSLYPPWYGEGAFGGKIRAIAFYNIVLTEAQLNAIAAAAVAQGAA